jgi:hypothetical protein
MRETNMHTKELLWGSLLEDYLFEDDFWID